MGKINYFLLPILMLFSTVLCAADESAVNVLCYHRFKPRNASDSYAISVERFRSHLQYLKDNNYNVISMKQYLTAMEDGKPLPDKSVMLTIDDGYKDIITHGYPVLKEFNYPCTVFLYQDFLPGGRSALNTADIKALYAEGLMDFGCHSKSHPVMTNRGLKSDEKYAEFLEKETVGAREYLRKKTGLDIDTMAYPYGAYSFEVWKFVEKAGFKAAFSVVPSYNTASTYKYALKRTIIYNTTKAENLRKILEMKPLKIISTYPADGDIIENKMPVMKAVFADDAGLNTATVRFVMGRVVLKDTVYDP
ncbi:MAG: polysaccharide deacetylase family protein, partial [Spirochaetia bacterium]|nr:polysaccharide deacetylase family protein [Spirochaetia bacterium]